MDAFILPAEDTQHLIESEESFPDQEYRCEHRSLGADRIRHYIETRYRVCYEADIRCSYPNVMAVTDSDRNCLAAVGYRTPDVPFYLEQYLDLPAEQIISALYGLQTDRSVLVEIGNLVGTDSRAVFQLMEALLTHLEVRGFEHVLMTGTRALIRRVRNLPTTRLAKAQRSRVTDAKQWGRYYDQRPEVITGRLQDYDQRFEKLAAHSNYLLHTISNTGAIR